MFRNEIAAVRYFKGYKAFMITLRLATLGVSIFILLSLLFSLVFIYVFSLTLKFEVWKTNFFEK